MIYRLSLLLFLASLLVSCGGKKSAKETSATFQLFVGAISDPNLSGGVMVYGREASGENFAINVTSDTLSFPIPNGSWNFYAFGWDGASPMTGTLRCGEASANLDGGDAVVSFTLSDANCSNGNYGAAAYKTANQFKPLRLVHCTDLSGVIDGTSDCTGVLSGTSSYEITMETFGAVPSTPLTSTCISDSLNTTGITDTTLSLPTGGFYADFLSVKIKTFKGAGCTTLTREFVFNSGFESGSATSEFHDDTSFNVAFMEAPALVIIPTFSLQPGSKRETQTGGSLSIDSAVEYGVQTQNLTGGSLTFEVSRKATSEKLRYLENNNLQLNIGTK